MSPFLRLVFEYFLDPEGTARALITPPDANVSIKIWKVDARKTFDTSAISILKRRSGLSDP
eukprot:Gb_20445 [translate_table: standard]